MLACPTGALSIEPLEALHSETATVVEPRPNGPLFVRGNIEIVDATGQVVRRAHRVALCRCGHSGNKPYCDLSHQFVGFKTG